MSFYIADVFPSLPPTRCNLQRSKNYWYFPGIWSLNPSFVLKSATRMALGARVKLLQIVGLSEASCSVLIADELGMFGGSTHRYQRCSQKGILGVSWSLLIPHSSRLFQGKGLDNRSSISSLQLYFIHNLFQRWDMVIPVSSVNPWNYLIWGYLITD